MCVLIALKSIENTSENIRTVFSIIQAYILLDSEVYLQQHGKKIVETCMYLLTDLRSEGIVMVMRLFESILRSTGNHGIELLRPALPIIFKFVFKSKSFKCIYFYFCHVAFIHILTRSHSQ